MTHLNLRQLRETDGIKLGTFVYEFISPGIGHLLKAAGCDFVFLDMEHSGFSFETLKSAIRYFEAADLPVLVRVPALENDMLARACDMGADGLMAPMISTAEQARQLVRSTKYFPQGMRGVGLQMAHDKYRPAPVIEALAQANARTFVSCLIETAAGAENAHEIAAVEGVDCLWVGHFDLSVSLGIPGQFGDSRFTSAMDKIAKAAKDNGKSLGRMAATPEQGVEFHKKGVDFCCYSGDAWLLRDALASGLTAIRNGSKK